ncbi:hypothetical protein [Acetivibrio ethanolgignens]|uniref:Uncharacterized protein n=1 Tax=Acetivibrio ethanolgignens TaxID=290052 RepID=A0A0V8QJV2_9FIRM|nr:hypothetical protein [Acetivibrio ethanolgignens]KSV60502.1 hypothetical protein ASU35_16620 [Acetivibrio ethanolgignens]
MEERKREIDGFKFLNKRDYVKAEREKAIIEQMKSGVNWKNPSIAFKLYNKILDKNSFSTIIGMEFLRELREIIIKSGISIQEDLRPIPVKKQEIKVDEYQALYEQTKISNKIRTIVIAFLILIIAGMLTVSYFTPYSIFTDYEEKIKNQYSTWEQELNEREAELEKKEAGLEKNEK